MGIMDIMIAVLIFLSLISVLIGVMLGWAICNYFDERRDTDFRS